ncbi:MAG: hypothetical protein IPO07_23585 [Haliscomenobacter sp.]|nr:hypothetical protein [Haliscomenobacter sp.]MBK9491434.1 hypothetical protein [Haliscomenobacter sp.]
MKHCATRQQPRFLLNNTTSNGHFTSANTIFATQWITTATLTTGGLGLLWAIALSECCCTCSGSAATGSAGSDCDAACESYCKASASSVGDLMERRFVYWG